MKCILMLVLQVLNFDGFYSTNSSNLQVLLQSKMSRITKRSLSKSNYTSSTIDNDGIKVDLLIPLESLDPNQKSHLRQHSRRSEKRGIVGERQKITRKLDKSFLEGDASSWPNGLSIILGDNKPLVSQNFSRDSITETGLEGIITDKIKRMFEDDKKRMDVQPSSPE